MIDEVRVQRVGYDAGARERENVVLSDVARGGGVADDSHVMVIVPLCRNGKGVDGADE